MYEWLTPPFRSLGNDSADAGWLGANRIQTPMRAAHTAAIANYQACEYGDARGGSFGAALLLIALGAGLEASASAPNPVQR